MYEASSDEFKDCPNLCRANMKVDKQEGEEKGSIKSFFITLN